MEVRRGMRRGALLCITLYLVRLALPWFAAGSLASSASAGDAFSLKFPDPGFKLHDREQIVRRLVRFAMHQLGNLHLLLHVQLDVASSCDSRN